MKLLCLLRIHKWRVSRVQGLRYGALVTEHCLRCPIERTTSRW